MEEDVVSRYRPGFMWFYTGFRPADLEKPRKYDRLVLDVHYNTWATPKLEKMDVLRSIGFQINTLWDKPLNKRNGIAIGFGLAYRFQKMGLLTYFDYDYASKISTHNDTIQSSPSFAIANFRTHQVLIPLEFRFRMKKWRHLKLHLGGNIGYRFGANFQGKTSDKNTETTLRNMLDAKGISYGLHARFGIRNWAFSASYDLKKQFNNSQSFVANPLSFGISLSFF